MEPILIEEHREGCWVNNDKNPWAFLPTKEQYCSKMLENTKKYRGGESGRAHHRGRYAWYQIICNDPKCTAKVRVSEDWILEQIENFLKEK